MRVLVTGGAGFIGSHVVQALADAGHVAVVLDAMLPAVHPAASPAVDPGVHPGEDRSRENGSGGLDVPGASAFVRADVRDRDAVDDALAGVDAVCHQAAMVGLGLDLDDAPAYAGCNDLGTAVLLAAMARAEVGRLVLAGSMVVYGEGAYACAEHGPVTPGARRREDLEAGRFEPPCPVCGAALEPGFVTEDARLDPRNVYAATKVAQEHLAAAWARVSGGRAVSLRYHNVYGPRMPRDTPYAGVASVFRSALAAGLAPQVYEDGCQRRDFVHVRDVAAANVVALEAAPVEDAALRAYNVGSGTPHTVGQMAAALAAAYGGAEPVRTGDFRLGDVRHVTASSARLQSETGWRPRVDFADGMAEFARAPQRAAPTR